MASWALQDAKARLSDVVKTARREGPQIITRRGVEEVAVVPIEQWNELRQATPTPTLLEAIQSGSQLKFDLPKRGLLRRRKPVRL